MASQAGPIGDVGFITSYRDYLVAVQTRTGELKAQGRSADDAAKLLGDEMAARYPDRGRLAGAVRAAWAQAK